MKPPESSPDKPLAICATMDYPPGVYYFKVPDPHRLTLWNLRHELQDPHLGSSVTVELTVAAIDDPYRLRWATRFLWAEWSLVAVFGSETEVWQIVTGGAGPRTRDQIRELYEVIRDLRWREGSDVRMGWAKVSRILWRSMRVKEIDPVTERELKEIEDRTTLEIKLAGASAGGHGRERHDPEVIVLEGFLQGKVSTRLICSLLDLDYHLFGSVLFGCQVAFERLTKGAVRRRCHAIRRGLQARTLTPDQAAQLLSMDWPTSEMILRLASTPRRRKMPNHRPTKRTLLKAIERIQNTKRAGSLTPERRPTTKLPADADNGHEAKAIINAS